MTNGKQKEILALEYFSLRIFKNYIYVKAADIKVSRNERKKKNVSRYFCEEGLDVIIV